AFPARLDGAPLLLPGEDAAIRPRLEQWLADQRLHPRIVGEFDDSALAKAFGQAGAGLFVAPTALAAHICEQHQVSVVGRIEMLSEQLYAITTERRLTHPAIVAISQAARDEIFAVPAGTWSGESSDPDSQAPTPARTGRKRALPKIVKKTMP
ncbi:MAG TPA: LysR substrate-binding domain-containing protein, partial [Accumulibacter sp.]|nr:LysR substrate-binding domain-containing protein [Accumulibacter sp.]